MKKGVLTAWNPVKRQERQKERHREKEDFRNLTDFRRTKINKNPSSETETASPPVLESAVF